MRNDPLFESDVLFGGTGDEDGYYQGRPFRTSEMDAKIAALSPPVSVAQAGPPAFSYTPPAYTGATSYNVARAPRFVAPDFDAPDPSEITSNPAYQFRLAQGIKALENSAAARGMVRHGGTYKGLVDYAGQSASQEVDNAFNRYLQEYDRNYRGAADEYAPLLAQWAARNEAARQNMMFDWQRYAYGLDDEFRREQLIADLMARAEAGQ